MIMNKFTTNHVVKQQVFQENIPQKIKRVAIFASFSKDYTIHDYVIFYLKELKAIADAIIFISDNEILPKEIDKIKDLVIFAQFYKHNEYDFGSYKRGFHWALENNIMTKAEELIFCNDSCYGPIFPFSEYFDTMQNVQTDFWGMVRSQEIKEHLQSYFLVFKRNVFLSHTFQDFVNHFEKQESQIMYILEYELNLTEILKKAGFTYTSYLDIQKHAEANDIIKNNPTKYPESLYRMRMPLIKKKSYLIDFSLQLKESIICVHNILAKHNSELYNAISKDIKQYYTTSSNYKTKEWLTIALSSIDKEHVLDFAANTAEHYLEMLGELQWEKTFSYQQNESEKSCLKKIVTIIRRKKLFLSIFIAINIITLTILTLSTTL